MSRQTLRDRNYHVIGYIDIESSGRQVLRDSYFHILGYYEPGRDETLDSHFCVVGRGNVLATLL